MNAIDHSSNWRAAMASPIEKLHHAGVALIARDAAIGCLDRTALAFEHLREAVIGREQRAGDLGSALLRREASKMATMSSRSRGVPARREVLI